MGFFRQEIVEALPEVDVVFIPVSGGGLISGIAAYLKEAKPSIKVSSFIFKSPFCKIENHEEMHFLDSFGYQSYTNLKINYSATQTPIFKGNTSFKERREPFCFSKLFKKLNIKH